MIVEPIYFLKKSFLGFSRFVIFQISIDKELSVNDLFKESSPRTAVSVINPVLLSSRIYSGRLFLNIDTITGAWDITVLSWQRDCDALGMMKLTQILALSKCGDYCTFYVPEEALQCDSSKLVIFILFISDNKNTFLKSAQMST